jgi:phage-related tail protein
MDLNKKLIDQLSDLSRNIKSLTSEVKENKNAITAENQNPPKEGIKEDPNKKESVEEQNKKFLKSLEGIFKKGVGEITKSNVESKGILKDVVGSVKGKGLESALGAISPLKDKALESITTNPNIPKGISALLGKIPKFASGGVMDKTGVALVGEKGPEVVKLDKGSKVIPAEKTEEIMSSMKTMDQTILEKKGPTNDQIEKYKNQLEKDDFYKSYPDRLIEDINTWKNRNKDRSTK